MSIKKVTLIPIIILLALLLAWFSIGLAAWIIQNQDWFVSLGPWGSSGFFMSLFISSMVTGISFVGVIVLSVAVAVGDD